MSARRTRLVDCNSRWIRGWYAGHAHHDVPCGVHFDCPEGHDGCSHAIPFTPRLDGASATGWQSNGCVWQRTGDTFETLTLSPSIRREPQYASVNAAIAAGCIEEHITASLLCAFHGFIKAGAIEFCGDSR